MCLQRKRGRTRAMELTQRAASAWQHVEEPVLRAVQAQGCSCSPRRAHRLGRVPDRRHLSGANTPTRARNKRVLVGANSKNRANDKCVGVARVAGGSVLEHGSPSSQEHLTTELKHLLHGLPEAMEVVVDQTCTHTAERNLLNSWRHNPPTPSQPLLAVFSLLTYPASQRSPPAAGRPGPGTC